MNDTENTKKQQSEQKPDPRRERADRAVIATYLHSATVRHQAVAG